MRFITSVRLIVVSEVTSTKFRRVLCNEIYFWCCNQYIWIHAFIRISLSSQCMDSSFRPHSLRWTQIQIQYLVNQSDLLVLVSVKFRKSIFILFCHINIVLLSVKFRKLIFILLCHVCYAMLCPLSFSARFLGL